MTKAKALVEVIRRLIGEAGSS